MHFQIAFTIFKSNDSFEVDDKTRVKYKVFKNHLWIKAVEKPINIIMKYNNSSLYVINIYTSNKKII